MSETITVHRVVKTGKQAGQYVEAHTHSFFHLIYGLSGHLRVEVDGQAYETERDTLVIAAPGRVHGVTSLDDSVTLDLKFTCSPMLAARLRRLPVCLSPVDRQASELIRSVLEEAVGQAPGYNELIDLRMHELVIVLERGLQGGQSLWQGRNYPIQAAENENIRAALEYIERNLERPLRVSDLARLCGYSTNYFRMFFKENMGIPPNCYINQRKISRAKELMLYSRLNVTQISELLGYQSIHYFSRLFKKLTGAAPTEYMGRVKHNRPINLVQNENTPPGEFELPVRGGQAEAAG